LDDGLNPLRQRPIRLPDYLAEPVKIRLHSGFVVASPIQLFDLVFDCIENIWRLKPFGAALRKESFKLRVHRPSSFAAACAPAYRKRSRARESRHLRPPSPTAAARPTIAGWQPDAFTGCARSSLPQQLWRRAKFTAI
jgi:hypothetical protein